MKYLFSFMVSLLISSIAVAQEIGYEITPTYRKSINKEKLVGLKTLKDLNQDFPASWIETYHSVNIISTYDGNLVSIDSENDMLNSQQISALNKADIGTDINVSVHYTPKNSAPDNVREMKFSYRIVPATDAKFTDDYQDIKDYLKTNVIDKLSKEDSQNLENVQIKFTIGTEGNPTNPLVIISSKNQTIDQLLIGAINNMPIWTPANLKDGTKVTQDFVLNVGSVIGC